MGHRRLTVMARTSKGGATPAITALLRAGVSHAVHPYEVDEDLAARTSYGEAVATAVGVEPTRLLKTLITTVDDRLVVGVVPVAASLDLKALAAAVGGKRATMAEPARAERATGYVTGGISPFGQRTRLPVVLDTTAGDHPTIFVSAGRRGLQVEVAPADLVALLGATVAPIASG